jgi:arginine decarboxylase
VFYAKLHQMGFPIEYLDVGGGLGVDYDGSRSAFDSSTNYTLQEYANDVVYYIGEVCNAERVPHPTIISEGGRAIVAHHSVLMVEVFGAIAKIRPDTKPPPTPRSEHPMVARPARNPRKNLPAPQQLEAYHDALERREDAHHMFTLGLLELRDKAKIENLYWEISRAGRAEFPRRSRTCPRKSAAREQPGDQYICNFSVFQSLLDHWALGQLFPIMPISRLNERPDREATLVDITCDSDGQVNKFIDLRDVRDTLPLHTWSPTATVSPNPITSVSSSWAPTRTSWATSTTSSAASTKCMSSWIPTNRPAITSRRSSRAPPSSRPSASVQYDEHELKRQMKAQVDAAIKSDRMKPSEGHAACSMTTNGPQGIHLPLLLNPARECPTPLRSPS